MVWSSSSERPAGSRSRARSRSMTNTWPRSASSGSTPWYPKTRRLRIRMRSPWAVPVIRQPPPRGAAAPPRGGGCRMTGTAQGDRILIRNLRVFGYHGVLPEEAERGQVFVIDLDLALDLEPAGRSDELDHTIDYGGLTARVAELVAGNRRQLLEAVAADVADLALADQRVEQVRVRVTKPHAPLGVDAEVAVEVVRGREVEYR